MKFYLHHTTQYSYSNPVIESANKILLYPFNDMNQQLVNHKLTISGNPNVFTYLDDYNNRVGFFTYVPPHKKLLITSEAEIISKKIVLPEEKTNTKDTAIINKELYDHSLFLYSSVISVYLFNCIFVTSAILYF